MSLTDYNLLKQVLDDAYRQAAVGKGRDRHASAGEAFQRQPICEITRRLGPGYPLGQAVKKIYESGRLEPDAAIRELLGAINYIAAAIIVREENKTPEQLMDELRKVGKWPEDSASSHKIECKCASCMRLRNEIELGQLNSYKRRTDADEKKA